MDVFIVTTNAAGLSTTSTFDRTLAKHLALHIAEGVQCDESIVRHCCWLSRMELNIAPHDTSDPFAEEVETDFVRNIVALMEHHQRFIAHMPENVASAVITELLLDKPW